MTGQKRGRQGLDYRTVSLRRDHDHTCKGLGSVQRPGVRAGLGTSILDEEWAPVPGTPTITATGTEGWENGGKVFALCVCVCVCVCVCKYFYVLRSTLCTSMTFTY